MGKMVGQAAVSCVVEVILRHVKEPSATDSQPAGQSVADRGEDDICAAPVRKIREKQPVRWK